MQPGGAHHFAVCVVDLARAERFYGDVLGLPLIRRWQDPDGSPRSVWLDLGDGTFLAVEQVHGRGPPRGNDASGWHCVALRIASADRDRWRRRLEHAGHPIEKETDYTLYVRDPEGAQIALSHFPERRSGERADGRPPS